MINAKKQIDQKNKVVHLSPTSYYQVKSPKSLFQRKFQKKKMYLTPDKDYYVVSSDKKLFE